MNEFSNKTRQTNIDRLSNETFDVLVVGGGITGATIARDAASRGLKVALVEKDDFASGTSGKSSKLIHGGFRYLKTFDFKLVREACKERHLMNQVNPKFAEPMEFLYPFYDSSWMRSSYLFTGLWIYDKLAGNTNIHKHKKLDFSRITRMFA